MTFLFTDIEGSTRLWQQDEAAMQAAMARHDELLRSVIEESGGTIFSTMGDGVAAVFSSAIAGIMAAQEAQSLIKAEAWPTSEPIRVRMGLHSGEAEEREGDFFGSTVHRAARLMAIGNGGQILCSSTTASLAEGRTPLMDLGEHRLRDLDRAMHVFQVGDEAPSALRSLDAFPGNLPLQLTSFIGRDRELKLIAEALLVERVVTLTGTGGVGKTRLALQAAADAISSFTDGVWLCELAAGSDLGSMCAIVASALGTVPRDVAPIDGLVDFIGHKCLLLVLDNCEHLLDPAAELTEGLVLRCPHLAVLATSREALQLAGEKVIRLPSLEVPARDAGIEEISQVPASRLFIERASAAGAEQQLSDVDALAVIEVCRRLDGIPLAIELAAARTIAMSPSEVSTHLSERFRLLTGRRRMAVGRHQTLRATIDWSYSLLSETEQRIFEALGVFPASFDGEAAQVVAAVGNIEAWDVVDALTSLVAKSLLTAERNPEGLTRYQLLESLRYYARERLERSGSSDAVRRRHTRYYSDFIDRFRREVQHHQGPWETGLETELENLRTAVLWSVESVDAADAELGLRILAVTSLAAQSAAATGLLHVAAQAVDWARRGDVRYRSTVLTAACLSAFYRGHPKEAAQLSEEAMVHGIVEGTPFSGMTELVVRLMFVPPGQIPRLVADGRAQMEHLGASDWELGHYLCSSTTVIALRGHLDVARVQITAGLEMARRMRNTYMLSVATYGYALAWWQTEPERALRILEEGMSDILGFVNQALMHRALALAAQLRSTRGDVDRALDYVRQAVHYAHNAGDRQGMATVVARGLFAFHAARRDVEAARLAGVVSDGILKGLHPLPPQELPGFQVITEEIESSLGADQFSRLRQQGAEMTYSDVVLVATEAAHA